MAKRPVPQYDFMAFGAAIKAARTGRAGADRRQKRAGQRHLFHLPAKGRGRYAGLPF